MSPELPIAGYVPLREAPTTTLIMALAHGTFRQGDINGDFRVDVSGTVMMVSIEDPEDPRGLPKRTFLVRIQDVVAAAILALSACSTMPANPSPPDASEIIDSVMDTRVDVPIDASLPLIDPVGTWNLIATWGAGDCNPPGTSDPMQPITVASSGAGFTATMPPAASFSDVSVTITRDASMATADFVADNANPTRHMTLHVVADVEHALTGSGTFTASGVCSQVFAVMGSIQ